MSFRKCPAARRQILGRFWESLCAQSWEELCRQQVPRLADEWGPASRWWHGTQPEWDVISESLDGERVLLGEAKWSARPFDRRTLEPVLRELAARPAPPLPPRLSGARTVRALLVPETAGKAVAVQEEGGPLLITAAGLLGG